MENTPQIQENIQDLPAPRKKLYPEHILLIITACCTVLLMVIALLCIPYYNQSEDPEELLHRDPPATVQTEPPQETLPEETMPQPEKNPYGRMDFQYNGRYLSCLKAETMPGIDVSAYQQDIDWAQVKASGIQFAIIRLGYRGYGSGKLVEDDYAIRNIENATKAGLHVGVYFFSQAITPEEAAEEAQFVLERIEKYDITMPIVFDWEYVNDEARTANMDRRTLTDCYLEFSRVIAAAGYTPMAYFNAYQSRTLMNLYELEEYPFWLAQYSDRMTFPYRIEMWQYTCTGRVPGIEGDVDINICFLED